MQDVWKMDLLRRAHDHLLDTQLILSELNNVYQGMLAPEVERTQNLRTLIGSTIIREQKKSAK